MIPIAPDAKPDLFTLVIDTDSYAGNFEREMGAYITGQIGDCGVGVREAQIANAQITESVAEFKNLVSQIPDEHGCRRPVSIYPNPRYGNDGKGSHALLTEDNKDQFRYPAYFSVAIYFDSLPGSDLLDLMKERAVQYTSQRSDQEQITVEGFRLFEQHTVKIELDINAH